MMTQEMQETVERTEIVAAEPTESLAAMLGIEMPHGLGDRVPPLWHWTYLLERSAQDVLGEDGHPLVGIPAPPAPDRRRMFAGGRVTTHSLLEIGKPATKVTSIANSVDKEGRSGSLTFVTVLQEIFQNGQLVISEGPTSSTANQARARSRKPQPPSLPPRVQPWNSKLTSGRSSDSPH